MHSGGINDVVGLGVLQFQYGIDCILRYIGIETVRFVLFHMNGICRCGTTFHQCGLMVQHHRLHIAYCQFAIYGGFFEHPMLYIGEAACGIRGLRDVIYHHIVRT